jgi:PAS domain S-box-containing protein
MRYRIQDLIDIQQFQALQDRLNEIYNFPSSIVDNEGNILTATAWQDICTKFHRRHPECERECVKSDQYILEHIGEANPAISYRCPHGLVDNATPIVIDGVHLGNFFTGQFFLEPPDLEFFRAQAHRFGFDEAAYLDAVRRVPMWTREKLNSYLFFIKDLIEVITATGLKHLRSLESSRRLEESERRFQAMFNVASIGIAQADPETGRWLRVNPKMCEITGYTAAELCQLRIPEITHPEDRDRDWEAFTRVVRGEVPSYRIEIRYIRKDGAVVWVSINMTVIRDNEGRPVQTMTTIEDITERRRSEAEQESLRAQLNQAQRLESVGRLAGGVAHDFNNMLGIILGNTELALMQSGPGQPHFEELQEIRMAAERSATLTRQLLAFARKQTIAPEVLDLNETVETTLKMLRRLIGEDIRLVWQPGREVWPIRADPSQIDQILANLSVNARDAIAGVGTVTIETGNAALDDAALARHPGASGTRYVVLSVCDDGCGMDEQTMAHLFEPFFTTKELGKGTGLGLATVYGIVTQNAGFIDVESEPGRGTTFRIYLPSYEPAATRDRGDRRGSVERGQE